MADHADCDQRPAALPVCARWLLRLLEEHPLATIEEAALVSALAALCGPGHEDAAASLVAMTERLGSPRVG